MDSTPAGTVYDPYREVHEEWEAEVIEWWIRALYDAWHIARGERLAELRGDRSIKRFDPRGVHPYSAAWGEIIALEKLLPELAGARLSDPECHPVSLRRWAHRDAQESFADELRQEGTRAFS